MRIASAHVPHATCLTQALAGQLLFERYGYPATVHIGVTTAGQGDDAALKRRAPVGRRTTTPRLSACASASAGRLTARRGDEQSRLENERRIQDAIDTLRDDMTIVQITHRLLTIRNADIICVLDDGRVVESGDWSTLIRRDGRFVELCKA